MRYSWVLPLGLLSLAGCVIETPTPRTTTTYVTPAPATTTYVAPAPTTTYVTPAAPATTVINPYP